MMTYRILVFLKCLKKLNLYLIMKLKMKKQVNRSFWKKKIKSQPTKIIKIKKSQTAKNPIKNKFKFKKK